MCIFGKDGEFFHKISLAAIFNGKRIENGKTDIQLSTLYRLLEFGLGKKVELTVR